jgi:hypothetical protein
MKRNAAVGLFTTPSKLNRVVSGSSFRKAKNTKEVKVYGETQEDRAQARAGPEKAQAEETVEGKSTRRVCEGCGLMFLRHYAGEGC